MSSVFSRSTSRAMQALASRVWIWLVMAAALGFTVRGVSLILSADRDRSEINALVVLMAELNSLEQALEEFEKGITPQELLGGGRSEDEIWREVVLHEKRRAERVREANPGFSDVTWALAEVDAKVRSLGELRQGVLAARASSSDVTPLEVRYHEEIDVAADTIKAAVTSLRARITAMSMDQAGESRQLTFLVWISCFVAIFSAVLCALYRRDLTRRRQAEKELARVHAELEQRVEERTSELSLANALLTEQVRERRRAEARLEGYAARLARSNAELQEFAYVASHDLQEPLRMVTCYVQLLQKRYRERLDKDADEFIAFAVDGAERMKHLIRDLLAYARVDAGERSFVPVECGEVLRHVLQNLKVAIDESGAQVASGPLPRVTADPTQLAQLFQNLIGNAIRFRGEAPPRIRIHAEASGAEHVFHVEDNGIGIEPVHFERIFRVFQRLHPREDDAGTGIGLAICKKIVERHGGSIWVTSQFGQGTGFHFTLPLRASAAATGKDAGVAAPALAAS